MTTNDIKKIRHRLWHSVEMGHVRLQFTLGVGLYLFGLLMASFDDRRAVLLPTIAVYLSLFIGPVVVFYLWRTFQIFRKPQEYVFCTTTLREIHPGILRDTAYYTVVLHTPGDGTVVTDTHSIFSTGSGPRSLELYNNKTVTIAWNRETGMVVVIE